QINAEDLQRLSAAMNALSVELDTLRQRSRQAVDQWVNGFVASTAATDSAFREAAEQIRGRFDRFVSQVDDGTKKHVEALNDAIESIRKEAAVFGRQASGLSKKVSEVDLPPDVFKRQVDATLSEL